LRELRMKRKTDLGFWREKGRKEGKSALVSLLLHMLKTNMIYIHSQEERWKIRTLEHNKQTFEI